MLRTSLFIVAATTLVSSLASASSISVTGNLGTGTENCGYGQSSAFLGSNVAEFNFNGVNSSVNAACTSGANPPVFQNFGAINGSFGVGSFGNIAFINSASAGSVNNTTSSGDIVTGSLSGQTASPWADNTPYLVIPGVNAGAPLSTKFLTMSLTGLNTAANYFGMYFGSVDTYNNVSFNLSDNTVINLTGSNIASNLAGAVSSGGQFSYSSNVFVNFFVQGATINSITFSSSQKALEVDNFAFGVVNVPAPGALLILGLGLLGLGATRRKLG